MAGLKDMISNLPDSILHYILSLLPIKDAIRTSILAKSWKYLWTDLSVFDFEHDLSLFFMKPDQREKSVYCLLDQVNRILYHSSCVKRLSFMLFGVSIDADRVNSLISSVVKHKIEELELSLLVKPLFVLPNCFSASESLNKLHLDLECVLHVPSGIHFSSLKTLQLSYVTFANAKSVQQLFSGCPVIQKLTLHSCNWKNIKQISIKLATLKILTIFCNGSDRVNFLNTAVKIDAVNLENFSCTTYQLVEYVLVNLLSLDHADIDIGKRIHPSLEQNAAACAVKLLSALGSIKSLFLSNDTLKCLSFAKDTLHLLPLFNNLTHLNVYLGNSEFTNEALMDILQKTPKLEVLDIPRGFDPKICMDGEDCILNSVPSCFEYSLELIFIAHFDGGEAEIQLLKFLLENATVLTDIWIFCSIVLFVDLKKEAEICNQLQRVGLRSCVIKFK